MQFITVLSDIIKTANTLILFIHNICELVRACESTRTLCLIKSAVAFCQPPFHCSRCLSYFGVITE
jgi:hypothetical protein